MFGTRLVSPRKGRDEGEKPFWISYADLMTALMMLFLVVMAVSLFAITSRGDRHEEEISRCMGEFEALAKKAMDDNVRVDITNRRVSFGERARFANKDYNLSSDSAQRLRTFTPVVLGFADSTCGRKLLKRVVVEGYTSKTGSYFLNLDLSLKRAHSVLCALFDTPILGEPGLTEEQKTAIRRLFLVGGYSSNSGKGTDEESRRVELKLEFWGLDEKEKKTKDKDPATEPGENSPQGNCMLSRHAIAN
jgi:flagellar motor protein MotB